MFVDFSRVEVTTGSHCNLGRSNICINPFEYVIAQTYICSVIAQRSFWCSNITMFYLAPFSYNFLKSSYNVLTFKYVKPINNRFDIFNRVNGLMSRVFASNLGDRGTIPGQVIPKTQKMVLYDTSVL